MKNLLIVCLQVLFASRILIAQESQIDSLKRVLPTLTGVRKIEVLIEMAELYERIDSSKALYFANEAVHESKKNNLKHDAILWATKAAVANASGEYKLAIEYATKGQEIALKQNDSYARLSNLVTLGYASMFYNQSKLSLQTSFTLIKLGRDMQLPKFECTGLYILASNYAKRLEGGDELYGLKRKDIEKYEGYTRLFYNIAIQKNVTKVIPTSYNAMGRLFLFKMNYDSAAFYFKRGVDFAIASKNEAQIIPPLYNLAEAYFRNKDYKNSIATINRLPNYLNKYKVPDRTALVELYKGNLYLKTKQYKLAEEQYLLALESSIKDNVLDRKIESYFSLYKLQKLNKEYNKALYYHEIMKALEDSVRGDKNANIIYEIENKYQLREKQNEIDKLKTEKTVTAIVSLFVVFFVALLIRTRYLKEKVIKQKLIIAEIQKQKIVFENESKNRELTSVYLSLDQKNQIFSKLESEVSRINKNTEADAKKEVENILEILKSNDRLNNEWGNLKMHFELISPGFFEKLKSINPHLTSLELRQCAYIKLNLSAKDVSNMLSISPKSVNISRSRIKKRLNLHQEQDLKSFINDL